MAEEYAKGQEYRVAYISFTEIKIRENGRISIIEISARMGCNCIGSDLVRYSTGYVFGKMVIDVVCCKELDFKILFTPFPPESRFILTQGVLGGIRANTT